RQPRPDFGEISLKHIAARQAEIVVTGSPMATDGKSTGPGARHGTVPGSARHDRERRGRYGPTRGTSYTAATFDGQVSGRRGTTRKQEVRPIRHERPTTISAALRDDDRHFGVVQRVGHG